MRKSGQTKHVNEFQPFEVNWWDVIGRDEEWKRQTIANTSQLQFDQEFGNTFFGTGDTLINGETLLSLRAKPPIEYLNGGDFLVYDKPQKEHEYLVCVDVSKGRGQDYSTFNVIDITRNLSNRLLSIAITLYRLCCFQILYISIQLYNDAYVVIETNDQGSVVCNGLYYDLEYENVHLSSSVKSNAIGIEMNRKTKRLGCTAIKDILEEGKLEIVDENTIMEISTFVGKGQSYEMSEGNHDDLMMNLVMFGYFVSTQFFADMTDINLKQMMFEEKMREIEQDVPPAGFIDDGSEHIEMEESMRQDGDALEEWWNDYTVLWV